MSIRLDMLIIKRGNGVIENVIGKIFRKYNMIEYKNPKDGLNIDVFCKAPAYAALYKSGGKTVRAKRTTKRMPMQYCGR